MTFTVDDPLQAHVEQLGKYTDEDMHDVLAYLQTLALSAASTLAQADLAARSAVALPRRDGAGASLPICC